MALRRLPRETRRFVPVPRVGERRLRQVEIHRPHVRLVGVLVDPHARDSVVRDHLPHREVEPQLVADDRAADLAIHVVQGLQIGRRPQALGLQRIREIAGLHPALGRVAKGRAPERVAAVLRDDVEVHPRPFRFAQSAGGVDDDFRRAGRIQELPSSRGLPGEVRVQAVGLGPRTIGVPAVDGPGEAAHATGDTAGISATDGDAGLRHVQSGNQGLESGGVPRAGDGGDDVTADRLLHLHALDVHDR